jgi:hypothetical protein
MDPTAIVIGSQSSSSHARSALPDAPVVERSVETRPARPRSATAAVLMRVAVRLDPSYARARRTA